MEERRDVVVGLDNGGTANNGTVLSLSGEFLIDGLCETPSLVTEGPDIAVAAMVEAIDVVLARVGIPRSRVRAVGLDTPGPASGIGVISSLGSINFEHAGWYNFDVRTALESLLGIPVVYNNDGNAAALYAHHVYFGDHAAENSSVSAIVGTGLGGGVVESGVIVRGAAGMAGELGHIPIAMEGLLADAQPVPMCNCGTAGDVESVASLTGIEKNLLPFWLTRFPDHPLAGVSARVAARHVRSYGERRDELALHVFEQQAMALGRLFTIAANFTDPNAYFLGGGVVEADLAFRNWFLAAVRKHTALRVEQERVVTFALIPDLDMAGARGSAIAALQLLPADKA